MSNINLTKLVGLQNLDIIVNKKGSVAPKDVMDNPGVAATQLCIILDFDGDLGWAERGKAISVVVLPIVSINDDLFKTNEQIYVTRYETAEDGHLGIVMSPTAAVVLNGAEDLADVELIGHIRYYAVPDYMRDYIAFEKLHLVYDLFKGRIQATKTQENILQVVESKIDTLRREASESIKRLKDENERIKAENAENFALEVGVKIDEVVNGLTMDFKDAFDKMGITIKPTPLSEMIDDLEKTVNDFFNEPIPTIKNTESPKVTKKTNINLVELPTSFTNFSELLNFIMLNYDEVKANHISNLWFADILHDQEKMKEIGKQKVYASRHYLKRVFGVEYYDQLIAVMSNIHVLSNTTSEKEEKPEEKEESSEPDLIPEPAVKKKPNNGNRSAGKVLQVRGGYQCCGKIFTTKQVKSILGTEFSPKSDRVKISDIFKCDDTYQKVLNAFKEYVGNGASIS